MLLCGLLRQIDITVILRLENRLGVDQVQAEVPRHVHVEHYAIAEVLETVKAHLLVLHGRVVHGFNLLHGRSLARRFSARNCIDTIERSCLRSGCTRRVQSFFCSGSSDLVSLTCELHRFLFSLKLCVLARLLE